MAVQRIELDYISYPVPEDALVPADERTREILAYIYKELEKGTKIIEQNEAKSWIKVKTQTYK